MTTQIVQSGQLNLSALSVAGVYIVIVPPQLLINGVATNIIGGVGTATWGPVNGGAGLINQLTGQVMPGAPVSSYASYVATFGNLVPRQFDLGTHIWNIYQQGTQAIVQCVRVTDGTDTAASVTIQTNCLTLTSKYTGSFANGSASTPGIGQSAIIGAGAQANSQRVTLLTPGVLPEVFDNILQGVSSIAVTAGTGYTLVPSLALTAAPAGGINASAGASLAVTGTPTVGAGGSGYAVNDFITLSNGVIVKVLTVTGGAVATLSPITTTGCNAGSITGTGTAVPANPVAQVSTTGAGTGATINLVWGLGPAVNVVGGSGYTVAPTATLSGGGAGTGGSYTASISYWGNIAAAINSGQGAIRGPSQNFVATAGVGTSTPTAQTYYLSGGTDGANVSAASLVGSPSVPYTGMYCLQGLGCSIGLLADCTASSTWASQVSFGLVNGIYMIGATASGDTISNASTELSTAGIDSYALKMMFGDWVYFLDTINNLTRLASPQGFVAGLLGNLAPNQSTLNKQIQGIVGTQRSQTGLPYQVGDLQTLVNARMDVIANPSAGGQPYFSCQNGRNSSSNAAIRGDNYTRMTNFLAVTFVSALGPFVGALGTSGGARRAKSSIDGFMSNMQFTAGLIGDPDNPGAPPAWSSTVNPTQSNGVATASLQVTYQSVTEFFVLSVQGGQTVTISKTTQALAA